MKRPNFFYHLHPPTIPAEQSRFRYTFGLGGLGVFFSLVAAFSGALLFFYYVPSAEQANASVQMLTYHVPLGWLVRNLHFWSAQGLVIVATLHLIRVAFTGGFRPPRRFNWLMGIGLLVLVIALDFSGYALRWDNEVGWALLVGTNLLREIPLIGNALYRLAVGGAALSDATVLRFFGWHVFGLVLPAAVLFVWHLFRIRRDGGISSPKSSVGVKPERIRREALVQREVLAALIAGAVLLIFAIFFNPGLGSAFDPSQPAAEVRAPWFFLWVQELLRWGDPFWMGILVPAGLFFLLTWIPYGFDRGQESGRWFPSDGRLAQGLVLTIWACISLLTLVGALR